MTKSCSPKKTTSRSKKDCCFFFETEIPKPSIPTLVRDNRWFPTASFAPTKPNVVCGLLRRNCGKLGLLHQVSMYETETGSQNQDPSLILYEVWAIWLLFCISISKLSIKNDIQQTPPYISCEGLHPVTILEPLKKQLPGILFPGFPKVSCGNVAIIHHFVAGNTSHLQFYTPKKTKNSMAKKNENYQGPLSKNEHQLCNDFWWKISFCLGAIQDFWMSLSICMPVERIYPLHKTKIASERTLSFREGSCFMVTLMNASLTNRNSQ